jgi:hypothetical protein
MNVRFGSVGVPWDNRREHARTLARDELPFKTVNLVPPILTLSSQSPQPEQTYFHNAPRKPSHRACKTVNLVPPLPRHSSQSPQLEHQLPGEPRKQRTSYSRETVNLVPPSTAFHPRSRVSGTSYHQARLSTASLGKRSFQGRPSIQIKDEFLLISTSGTLNSNPPPVAIEASKFHSTQWL